MGKIGRENADGSVDYFIVDRTHVWDFEAFDLAPDVNLELHAPSVEAFFTADTEDFGLRLLFRLDGTGVCRRWGDNTYELIWRRISLSQ